MILSFKNLVVLSLQDISLISLAKTACVFPTLAFHYGERTNERMNERTNGIPQGRN